MRLWGACVLALLAAMPAAASAAPERMECWLSARCDPDGCAAEGLLVVVQRTGAAAGPVVRFGEAEERNDVRVIERSGYLLLTGRTGADGGAFSLRIDDGGAALLSLGGTAEGGIMRHGWCRRPQPAGT